MLLLREFPLPVALCRCARLTIRIVTMYPALKQDDVTYNQETCILTGCLFRAALFFFFARFAGFRSRARRRFSFARFFLAFSHRFIGVKIFADVLHDN